ncbi:MAG: hypothetical protein HY320_14025 [Armatimonadetes bacterium]|nr:hypothetical protein [Armatimonadota bacterium]
MIPRGAVARAVALGLVLMLPVLAPGAGDGAPAPAKRIAFLVDSWHPVSHADVIGTRLLEGYRLGDRMLPSPVTVAWLHQSDPRPNHQGRELAAKYGVRLAGSVAEALLDDPRATQPRLAVDGVLIAVRTPLPTGGGTTEPSGQFRLFRETMAAFDRAGARVPVFVDKNLAATWEESQTIVAEATRRGVPLMAGSVVPWVPLDPTPPAGQRPTLAVSIASAPYRLYAIHVAELLQAFLEARSVRETGVASVREVGRGFWSMPDRQRWGDDVLHALLGVARTRGGRARSPEALGDEAYIVLVQYLDGARGVVALLPRMFDDSEFLLGARYEGHSAPYLGSIVLGRAPYDHFGYLAHALVQFYMTGRPPIPAERTLLSTGISLFGLRSRELSGQVISVPSLAVTYSVPSPSTR